MEKKYLIGYLFGRESVIFDDVKDFSETFDEDSGLFTIKFKDVDGEYEFVGNDNRGYKEVHGKAPMMHKYKVIGRRTARRHDYVNPQNRRQAPDNINYNTMRPRSDEVDSEDVEDVEDEEEIEEAVNTRTPRRRWSDVYGCGYSGPGCGFTGHGCGFTGGSCGGGSHC